MNRGRAEVVRVSTITRYHSIHDQREGQTHDVSWNWLAAAPVYQSATNCAQLKLLANQLHHVQSAATVKRRPQGGAAHRAENRYAARHYFSDFIKMHLAVVLLLAAGCAALRIYPFKDVAEDNPQYARHYAHPPSPELLGNKTLYVCPSCAAPNNVKAPTF